MPGKQIRLSRIFREGRTFISALDFGGFMGPVRGLQDPGAIIRTVCDAGANAILVNPGLARSEWPAYAGRCGLIMRITGGATCHNPNMAYHTLICEPEEALAMGADAVCLMIFVGAAEEQIMFENLGSVVARCRPLGLPVLAELLPADMDHSFDPEYVGVCARVGYELGADFIKTYFTGPGFDAIVRSCKVPIVIAGGPKTTDPVTMARDAIAMGAAGIAFGRNVFQAEDPAAMARELSLAVHGKA